MFQSSVPYGSQQLPVEHDQVFVMPWLEQLATQSEELNVEHEGVLRKLNSLLSALNTSDRNRIAMACTNMSAEARVHFAKEEEMMHAADYPERAAHIEQHDELLRLLARILFKLRSNIGFWSSASERTLLEQWFVPHLTYADQRFSEFMAARRASANKA